MLYLNGKQHELTSTQIKDLKRNVNLPVKLVYPESFIRHNPKNRLPDQPVGISILMKQNIRTTKGIEEWRYAKNTVVNSKGITIYVPHVIEFTGKLTLTDLDIELLWFLYYKSSQCANGDLKPEQRRKAAFEILDEKRRADDKIAEMQPVAKFEVLLLNEDSGLTEERLRELGYAYFIPNAADLSTNQIRLKLRSKVLSDKPNGIDKFLNLVQADKVLEDKAKIQKALDSKVIYFVGQKRKWVWNMGDQKPEDICQVVGGANIHEALYTFITKNQVLLDRLNAELDGKAFMESGKEIPIVGTDEVRV